MALRALAWAQFKRGIHRWFFWESAYYANFQCYGHADPRAKTNVFRQAQTFGCNDRFDPVLGRTGWNYSNGDGVLFYPGTDKLFPADSYNIPGPFASLRLKHWRRGIQDDPTWVRTDISWLIDPDKWEMARAELAAIIEFAAGARR